MLARTGPGSPEPKGSGLLVFPAPGVLPPMAKPSANCHMLLMGDVGQNRLAPSLRRGRPWCALLEKKHAVAKSGFA